MHLSFDQIVSTLLLRVELVVGVSHLLSNLRLHGIDFISGIMCHLRRRGRVRGPRSIATAAASADDVDVDIAGGAAVEGAELGRAGTERDARQLTAIGGLVGDSIDFRVVGCETRRAHEFGHLLLTFDRVKGRLERYNAGHNNASAEKHGCCRPFHAALLGDCAAWEERRAL